MVHMYWKVSLGIVVVHAPFPGERKLSSSVVDCHDIEYEDGCLLLMGRKYLLVFGSNPQTLPQIFINRKISRRLVEWQEKMTQNEIMEYFKKEVTGLKP